MFTRVARVPKKNSDEEYEYLQILESYHQDGQSKHRVVANLGRLDKLGGKLDRLVEALSKYTNKPLVMPEHIEAADGQQWGHILLARHLYYGELRLNEIIAKRCRSSRRQFDVSETAFVLLANRLTEPQSEHGLARWLEHAYVCNRHGIRWQPEWLPEEEISKEQRVRVAPRQLQMWYRTLDALLAARKEIEKDLYLRVRDLFHLKVDLVLYDVTNTYFARRSPAGRLRRHGKSKDGRRRNVLVVLGVVMVDGWPIAHHVFPGNTVDKKTFQPVVKDLEDRFGLRRVLLIGDRGMVSPENLEFLSEAGREVRYLLGIPERRSEEATAVFNSLAEEEWVEVDAGNRVQEVGLDDSGIRYFVVESDERKAYEKELRQADMAKVAAKLKKVQANIEAGRLKKKEKIGSRAAGALSSHHGKRYYSWEAPEDGVFRYWEDPEKLAKETIREGRYLLKTEDPNLVAEESVGLYKQLSDVEWGYRDLKDVIGMRPVHHKTDPRIEAHLFVATLALFLKRTLEHRLQEQALALTATEAFEAMKSMMVSVLEVGDCRQVLVHGAGRDARRLVKALQIADTSPPAPVLGTR